jgi:hypothetical protein
MIYSTRVNILKDLNVATKLNEVIHNLFGNMIVVVFYLQMHQNNLIYFFKIIFYINLKQRKK